MRLCRLGSFQTVHREWNNEALEIGRALREDRWSEPLAVGNLTFVDNIRTELGSKGLHRGVEQITGAYALREQGDAHNGDFSVKIEPLNVENTIFLG